MACSTDLLAGAVVQLRQGNHVQVARDGIGLVEDVFDDIAQKVRSRSRAVLQSSGKLMDGNRRAIDREIGFESLRIENMRSLHIIVTRSGSRNGARAQARNQSLTQADKLAYAAAGIHAGIFDDVTKLG